jgi:hypothetical protein
MPPRRLRPPTVEWLPCLTPRSVMRLQVRVSDALWFTFGVVFQVGGSILSAVC